MLPTAKRLRKQLSGIINFIRYREDKLGLLLEKTKQREVHLEALSKARAKNEQLLGKLQVLREQTAEEAKLIGDLEKDCQLMESTIAELNNEQGIYYLYDHYIRMPKNCDI